MTLLKFAEAIEEFCKVLKKDEASPKGRHLWVARRDHGGDRVPCGGVRAAVMG